jgi:hypothetical protein
MRNSAAGRTFLLGKDHRLHARNIEPLAAADIFAGHQIIFAQHVGSRLGEAGAVALVGAARKLALLGPDQPCDFILAGLLAMRAVERRRFLLGSLVKKVSFFHGDFDFGWFVFGRWSLVVRRSSLVVGRGNSNRNGNGNSSDHGPSAFLAGDNYAF